MIGDRLGKCCFTFIFNATMYKILPVLTMIYDLANAISRKIRNNIAFFKNLDCPNPLNDGEKRSIPTGVSESVQ